jgi:hypothetical protein
MIINENFYLQLRYKLVIINNVQTCSLKFTAPLAQIPLLLINFIIQYEY